jgi:hypothetical protein
VPIIIALPCSFAPCLASASCALPGTNPANFLEARFEPTLGREWSALRFGSSRAEEVKAASRIADDDEFESIGKCAAYWRAIAGEGGKDFSPFDLRREHSAQVCYGDCR